MKENCWYYKSKCVKKQPKDYYGFIYKIIAIGENLPTDIQGKIYIGKKAFTHTTKRKLSKKKKLALKTRARSEKVVVDSKWMSYWGSSKELIEDIKKYGEENFERKIIHLVYTKSECNYYEAVEIIRHRVLMPYINSYNKWLSVKVFKNRTLQDIEL